MITRLDCAFYRGNESGAGSSFIAFNPRGIPGSLAVAGSCAVRDSISSQVACKLALQHFMEGVENYFTQQDQRKDERPVPEGEQPESSVPNVDPFEVGLQVLEQGFKTANNMVYEFGHKMAAGGRMAASLISLVVLNNVVAAGRVGSGSAYLCRRQEVFPFFENVRPAGASNSVLDAYLGSNSMVSVELASVPLAPLDVALIFSAALDTYQELELSSIMTELEIGYTAEGLFKPICREGFNACEEVAKRLFPDPKALDFAVMVAAGPDTIYLKDLAE